MQCSHAPPAVYGDESSSAKHHYGGREGVREQGAPTNKLEGLLQLSAAVQAGLRDLCRPLCHKCSVEWLPCQLLRDDLQRHAYAGREGQALLDSNDNNAASPPPPCTRADPSASFRMRGCTLPTRMVCRACAAQGHCTAPRNYLHPSNATTLLRHPNRAARATTSLKLG